MTNKLHGTRWTLEYDDETGWWVLSDGDMEFETKTHEEAAWLKATLNASERKPNQ